MIRRPLRITLAPGSRLPSDEPLEVVADAAVVAEAFGNGRWALHDPDDRDHAALATAGPATDGIRIVEVVVAGWRFELEVEDAARAALRERARRSADERAHGGPLEVRAIIPGRIMEVSVAAGDEVVLGQQLLVVEAMKMQNELRAPRTGTIERVVAVAGATVELGDLLVVIG